MAFECLGADRFYTPRSVANGIAEVLPASLSGNVFDPTVGEGSLLGAVADRFGSRVRLLGLDIDARVIDGLAVRRPSWILGKADMLSRRSRSSSTAWRTAKNSLSAVVMNPPFSYRGNGGSVVNFGEFEGRVAPAMHFLVEVLRELHPEEGFYVVLPEGALRAERAIPLWDEIGKRFTVERLRVFGSSTFRGARASTSLVRIGTETRSLSRWTEAVPLRHLERDVVRQQRIRGCRCLEVVRGRVPVHTLLDSGEAPGLSLAPFVHTTSLERRSWEGRCADAMLADFSPMVLITRVGSWRSPRLIDTGKVVLSDCLFGLRPRVAASVGEVLRSVALLEPALRAEFRGTGAKYLTLSSLVGVLSGAGWNVEVVKAGSAVGQCVCGSAGLSAGDAWTA